MKKTAYIFASLAAVVATGAADARPDDKMFRREMTQGLDLYVTRTTVATYKEDAPGELGYDVYQTYETVRDGDVRLFIPASMYVRGGGGMNLSFATAHTAIGGHNYDATDTTWAVQIGLGWNLSSYVRAELDFQNSSIRFADLDDASAETNLAGATLWFDFARRYVQTGDITRRRTVVPFMGIGVAGGAYEFAHAGAGDVPNFAAGGLVAAPRGVLGVNVMFNDLIGMDIAYQYQLMIPNVGGARGVSNIMASIRANF